MNTTLRTALVLALTNVWGPADGARLPAPPERPAFAYVHDFGNPREWLTVAHPSRDDLAHAKRSPQTLSVTSCADDGSAGTLRSVVAGAASGDTIDLGTLSCSTITLLSGAIPITQYGLGISGSPAHHITIDGGGRDRVFNGVSAGGTLILSDLTITNGKYTAPSSGVAFGGCIYMTGSVSLENASVTNCSAIGTVAAQGGGVYATFDVSALYSTFSGNIVSASGSPGLGFGGAIRTKSLLLVQSTIDSNDASAASYGYGGGAFATTGEIANSTISNNRGVYGGGLALLMGQGSGSNFKLIDSTVSGNLATKMVGGVMAIGDIKVENTTIAFNTETYSQLAGGLYINSGTLSLYSTILSNNTTANGAQPLDIGGSGQYINGSHNLANVSSVPLPADTLTGHYAMLEPLADNGGLSKSHLLQRGSPAIDTGANPYLLRYDQRGAGYLRTIGANTDMGAIEFSDRIFTDSFDL